MKRFLRYANLVPFIAVSQPEDQRLQDDTLKNQARHCDDRMRDIRATNQAELPLIACAEENRGHENRFRSEEEILAERLE